MGYLWIFNKTLLCLERGKNTIRYIYIYYISTKNFLLKIKLSK